MASIKLYLDTRSPRKDGTYPLKIGVTHKGNFFINLKIYLYPDQLIENEVVNHKSKRIYNVIIEQWLVNIKKTLLDLGANGELPKLSHQQLKKIIENQQLNKDESLDEKPYLFETHFDKFILNKSKQRTKEIYLETFKKINKYNDLSKLTFENINLSWLRDFQLKLSQEGISINGQGIHFRNIRAIFNDAIDEDLIPLNIYPFRKFKIKKEATLKRSMTVEELIKLRDFPCDEYLVKYRDIFMLIFYLIGINIIDLLHLKEIKNGNIEYRRAKTGRLYVIEVLPEAKAIFDKYKGDKYLLNVLDKYKKYQDFSKRLNMNLKKIGSLNDENLFEPLIPDLTTYYARHTWATIAASLDIPKETIAAALGHGGNSVTDIYINFDRKKINEANRKVIDYVNSYTKEKSPTIK